MGTIEPAGRRAPHFPGRPGQHPCAPGESVCQFTAAGDFTASDRDQVRQLLTEAVDGGWPAVEIDFALVRSIDVGTARMLADCRYHAARQGCQLTVVNLAIPRSRRSVETLHGIGQLNGDDEPPL